MATQYNLTLPLLILSLIYIVNAQQVIIDVTKYGAKANSNKDISQAILSAWKEACESMTPSTIVIPKGTYHLNQVKLEGPCKAPLELQVKGTLRAPLDPDQLKAKGEWVTINHIDQFTLSGGGTFDGQGALAWKQNNCGTNTKCKRLPYNLSFNFLTNSTIRDVTSLDSKNFHCNVIGCKNVTFVRYTIIAPAESINTDGIHVARSTNIKIIDSTIKTGDDCISVGDDTQQLSITNVTCGPGHGISIGSLGRSPNEEPVVGVFVKNCTFVNTDNGVRIKTWPASHVGLVTDVHFEDIIMQDVANPIVVDQEYCPWNQCNKQLPSQVKLSKLSFKNIRGTSSTQVAVTLLCSRSVPCEGVEIGGIHLTYNGKEGPTLTKCANVKPIFEGRQIPPVCANSAQST